MVVVVFGGIDTGAIVVLVDGGGGGCLILSLLSSSSSLLLMAVPVADFFCWCCWWCWRRLSYNWYFLTYDTYICIWYLTVFIVFQNVVVTSGEQK